MVLSPGFWVSAPIATAQDPHPKPWLPLALAINVLFYALVALMIICSVRLFRLGVRQLDYVRNQCWIHD